MHPAYATGFWRHVGAFGPVLFFADGSVLLVQRHSARSKPSNGMQLTAHNAHMHPTCRCVP